MEIIIIVISDRDDGVLRSVRAIKLKDIVKPSHMNMIIACSLSYNQGAALHSLVTG